jgi:chaperone modulatory protein CbpM
VQPAELERWVAETWVRPERRAGQMLFSEIDVARTRLLVELRDELRLDEDALPVVLSLLDQLYAARRRMRLLCEAIDEAGGELHEAVAASLRRRIEAGSE